MPANREVELCHYHYDPLDRLVGRSSTSDNKHLRFYCKDRLATELQGTVQHSIFQQNEQLLAQQNRQVDLVEASLLATDQMRSVLQVVKASGSSSIASSPYGIRPAGSGLLSLLGFNGERPDPITGHYLLGNGYRAFNPVLMRFNSPDNLSPFGKGGLNPYAYCLGDPVNRYDKNGHFSNLLKRLSALSGSKRSTKIFRHAHVNKKTKQITAYPKKMKELFADRHSHSSSPEKYLQRYNKIRAEEGPARIPLMTVSTVQDLRPLSKSKELTKFVFTDQKQFVIGSDTVHPTLSAFVGRSSVTSAGYIRETAPNKYMIVHRSGHYMPSYSSLSKVKNYLEGLGVQVELRHHKDWLNP